MWEHVEVGKDLQFVGESREGTLIDGGAFYPAVFAENSVVTLSTLTLTGDSSSFAIAAALNAVSGADVTLLDVRVGDIDATVLAYAILSQDSTIVIRDSFIEDNSVAESYLFEAVGGAVEITNSVFWRNTVGGMWNFHRNDLVIANNLVVDNVSDKMTDPIVFNDDNGANVQVVTNNTFANSAFIGGSAVYIYGDIWFRNNIISQTGSGTGLSMANGSPMYNDVWGHGDNYSGLTVEGPGSLEANPWFIDAAAGDYHLNAAFSACIDAGDPNVYWNDADGSANDMGAYGGPQGVW